MHPSGFEVQLAQPLDFYAVTDHAQMLGLIGEAADTSTTFSDYELSESYHGINDSVDGGLFDIAKRNLIFNNFRSDVVANLLDGTFNSDVINGVSKSAWVETVNAANEAYRPGQFTTFAAYEYTSSTEESGNLHRNVVFRATDKLPAVPFSRLNSINPEGLWHWMDGLREQGMKAWRFPTTATVPTVRCSRLLTGRGTPSTRNMPNNACAMNLWSKSHRSRGPPILTHYCHPMTNGPISKSTPAYRHSPTQHCPGWLRARCVATELATAANIDANPYKFGVIGSSDTHTAAA